MYTYLENKNFLNQYLSLIELKRNDSRVLLSPTLQGRVLTSSANGDTGYSFGWINYDLIESQRFLPHCNNFGGEDRYWLGPEGGQNALFFKPGVPQTYDFEDWQAPSVIDTDVWSVNRHSDDQVSFEKEAHLINNSNYAFHCRLNRVVRLLTLEEIKEQLHLSTLPDVTCVGFRSENSLTNIGTEAWTKQTGGLSIWILGQFIPSDNNHVILPVKDSKEEEINDVYFGKIGEDRLQFKDQCYYFTGDGKKRGKIGIPSTMVRPIVFSLDEENETLTVVLFSFEEEAKDYVNSMWEYQKNPYKGDVINSYNDGPLEDGSIMGPFYEIETSSKALFLNPNEKHVHKSTTIHFKGALPQLQNLLQKLQKMR